MLLRFALVLGLVCSGCFLRSDDPPPISEPLVTTGAAEPGWSIEIGYGEDDFVALADGAHVSKVDGMQGGSHVPVSARLHGAGADELSELVPRIEVEVILGGALHSRSVTAIYDEQSAGADAVDFLRVNAFVGGDAEGSAVIKMKVATRDGTKWAAAERSVVIDD